MSWWPSNFSSSQMLVVLFWSTLLVLILGWRCQGYFTIKTLTIAPRKDLTTTRICLLWLVRKVNAPTRRTIIKTIQSLGNLLGNSSCLCGHILSVFLCRYRFSVDVLAQLQCGPRGPWLHCPTSFRDQHLSLAVGCLCYDLCPFTCLPERRWQVEAEYGKYCEELVISCYHYCSFLQSERKMRLQKPVLVYCYSLYPSDSIKMLTLKLHI